MDVKERIYVSRYDWGKRAVPFDDNWKFFQGEAPDAEKVCFDDSGWSGISLPHDYSISQPYSPDMEAESGYLPGGVGWYRKYFFLPGQFADRRLRLDFDGVYMNATVWVNGTLLGSHPYGYTPFSFDLTPHLIHGGENLLAVRVNHKTPSSRWYSGSGIYRSVNLTVTGPIHTGPDGITVLTPKLEMETDGPVTLRIRTVIENQSEKSAFVSLIHTIYRKGHPEEDPVGFFASDSPVTVLPGESRPEVCEFVTLRCPRLWSPEEPVLYVVKTQIMVDHHEEECCLTDFGFRFFRFDRDGGFFLNGRAMKLKGVCLHHDQGALGAAAFRRAMERQVELLSDMGCNSIRVTHNPAAKSLIDLCSQKGILVLEEIFDGWQGSKNGNTEDFGRWYGRPIGESNTILGKSESMTWEEFDLKSTIRRDINAPCIILWSLGNEVMEGIGIDTGGYPDQAARLIAWARETDDSRPVTIGENRLKTGQPESIRIGELFDRADGVVGFNYTPLSQLDYFHRRYPSWRIYGSETASSINSRGVYVPERYDRQFTSYDESRVAWGHYASQSWYDTIRKDYVAGTCVWTGFDYIGEPTNYNGIGPGAASLPWPSPKNSYFGILDTAGFPKDSYYLYQSLWNDRIRTVHILPAWNEDMIAKDENGRVRVVVYSNARSVELFLTPFRTGVRTSLGKKTFTVRTSEGGRYVYQYYEGEDREPEEYRNLYLTWRVPYEDGTLLAVGYDEQGAVIAHPQGRSMVTTNGDASRIVLTADRTAIEAGGTDLCYITAEIVDSRGNPVPNASDRIDFQICGEGSIAGVDNGLSVDHDPYQAHSRRAFGGKALAIVRAAYRAGSFTLEASSGGLKGAAVTVAVREDAHQKEKEAAVSSYSLNRNYYLEAGQKPDLPRELTVNDTDGTVKTKPLFWEDMDGESIRLPGCYLLRGTAGGLHVSVNLFVISRVAAVLNYSALVTTGSEPALPMFLQGVGADGSLAATALPVKWEKPGKEAFAKEGIVVVHGSTDASGRPFTVTASIRVQDRQYVVTDDVASKARRFQTVSEDLSSIILLFSYDTQELLGRASLSFAAGEDGAPCPAPGSAAWYLSNVSPDGPWTLLPAKETVEENPSVGGVKRYLYDFAPTMATYLRLIIRHTSCAGSPGPQGTGPSLDITEAGLYRAEAITAAHSLAEISCILINGTPVPPDDLARGEFHADPEAIQHLEVFSEVNAAITVLPVHNGIIRILTQSENHGESREFRIYTGVIK